MRSNTYKTKNKEYIVDVLKEHEDIILSVEDIHSYLLKKNKNMNITTIYRNLEKLASNNTILKFPSENGLKSQYQLKNHDCAMHDHIHLQCSQCGKIIHLDCNFMTEINEHLNKYHNFDLSTQSSILFGLCEDCRKKNNK